MTFLKVKSLKKSIPFAPGYLRFYGAWLRFGLDEKKFPTEQEWEQFFYPSISLEQESSLSILELIKIFPQSLTYYQKLLKSLKKERRLLEKNARQKLIKIFFLARRKFIENPSEAHQLTQLAYEFIYERPLKILHQKIQRVKYIIALYSLLKPSGSLSDDNNRITYYDLEAAKAIPISSFIEPNRAGFILCPFHKEKTPSCKIYNNRFFCFGCGEFGDTIDLFQKLFGVGFLEAVKKLLHK